MILTAIAEQIKKEYQCLKVMLTKPMVSHDIEKLVHIPNMDNKLKSWVKNGTLYKDKRYVNGNTYVFYSLHPIHQDDVFDAPGEPMEIERKKLRKNHIVQNKNSTIYYLMDVVRTTPRVNKSSRTWVSGSTLEMG